MKLLHSFIPKGCVRCVKMEWVSDLSGYLVLSEMLETHCRLSHLWCSSGRHAYSCELTYLPIWDVHSDSFTQSCICFQESTNLNAGFAWVFSWILRVLSMPCLSMSHWKSLDVTSYLQWAIGSLYAYAFYSVLFRALIKPVVVWAMSSRCAYALIPFSRVPLPISSPFPFLIPFHPLSHSPSGKWWNRLICMAMAQMSQMEDNVPLEPAFWYLIPDNA